MKSFQSVGTVKVDCPAGCGTTIIVPLDVSATGHANDDEKAGRSVVLNIEMPQLKPLLTAHFNTAHQDDE